MLITEDGEYEEIMAILADDDSIILTRKRLYEHNDMIDMSLVQAEHLVIALEKMIKTIKEKNSARST
jgi:uncharacterized protein with PIN domain